MRTATTFKAKCSLSEIMKRDEVTLVMTHGRVAAIIVPLSGIEVDQAFRTPVLDIVKSHGVAK